MDRKSNSKKITTLYCRLSIEDGRDNESMSISKMVVNRGDAVLKKHITLKRKNIVITLAIFLVALIVLCRMFIPNEPKYHFELKTLDEVTEIYHKQHDRLERIVNIISKNEKYQAEMRYTDYEFTGWIMSPYDDIRMSYFTEDEQKMIRDFMEDTHPYELADRNGYFSFWYINETQTSSYGILYFHDPEGEDSIEEVSRRYRYTIEEIDGSWVIVSHREIQESPSSISSTSAPPL